MHLNGLALTEAESSFAILQHGMLAGVAVGLFASFSMSESCPLMLQDRATKRTSRQSHLGR